MRIDGTPGDRARGMIAPLALVAFAGFAASTIATLAIRWTHPPALWTIGLPIVAIAALALAVRASRGSRGLEAFLASSAFLAALFAAAAATLYPMLLPGYAGSTGIGIFDAAPSIGALASAVAVVAVGVVAVCVYGSVVLAPRFREKITVRLNP